MKGLLLIITGTLSALASLFFFYYTARLVYVNLTAADAAAHRSGGMLIGAVAFPVAAIVFGAISCFCVRRALRPKQI